MDLTSAFSTIIAAGGSVAAIGFLARLFANSLASFVINRFNLINAKALDEQRLVHQKEIEDIKSQLNKLQKEHEIVFSSLYIKRENAILQIYKLMSEMVLLARRKLKEPKLDIETKCNELSEHFELNRLYFPCEVANQINNVINTAFDLTIQKNQKSYEQLTLQLSIQVYDNMESIFRNILKIEDY